MEQRRHRIAELFADADTDAHVPVPAGTGRNAR
jgi:hypothetical protein